MSVNKSSGNGSHGRRPRIGERVEHMGSSAQNFWSEARGAVDDLSHTLDYKSRVKEHPYLTLAAAAGVGYVLGGGLLTRFTMRLVRIGIRLAALPFVKDELAGLAEAAFSKFTGAEGHERRVGQTRD